MRRRSVSTLRYCQNRSGFGRQWKSEVKRADEEGARDEVLDLPGQVEGGRQPGCGRGRRWFPSFWP